MSYQPSSVQQEDLHFALLCFYHNKETPSNRVMRLVSQAIRSACITENRRANESDLLDVCQNVWLKLLGGRGRFTYSDVKSWRCYLRRCALTCWCVWFRQNKVGIELRPHHAQANFHYDHDRDIVEDLLGEICFGYEPFFNLGQRNRLVRAARWFYIEGWTLDEVLESMAPAVDRVALRGWLTDQAIVADLAYRTLYLLGDRSARRLLDIEENQPSGALLKEIQAAPVTSASKCKATKKVEIDSAWKEAESAWPFAEDVQELNTKLGASSSVLTQSGVWKRLAFQYWYRDELHFVDIVQRLCPMAELAGFHLTPGMLNMWLCGGRILQAMKRLADRRGVCVNGSG